MKIKRFNENNKLNKNTLNENDLYNFLNSKVCNETFNNKLIFEEIYKYFYYKENNNLPEIKFEVYTIDEFQNNLYFNVLHSDKSGDYWTCFDIYHDEDDINELPNILKWLEDPNLIIKSKEYNL